VSLNLAEQTRKVLGNVTPREEKVLRMRFGIGEKADHTLEEVGQDFAVTGNAFARSKPRRCVNFDIRPAAAN
jgi:DNA-directed RNA polymerase sigma subunit (sigma70/sigma32)